MEFGKFKWDFERYTQESGLRRSWISDARRSGARAAEEAAEKGYTEALIFGQYVEALIQAPHEVNRKFVVMPVEGVTKQHEREAVIMEMQSRFPLFDWCVNRDKKLETFAQKYHALQSACVAVGRKFVTHADKKLADEMVEFASHGVIEELIFNDEGQRQIAIRAPILGVPCKGLIDEVVQARHLSEFLKAKIAEYNPNVFEPNADVVIDIKTAVSAKPKEFLSAASRYDYFLQIVFYTMLWEKENPGRIGVPVIVALEKAVHGNAIAFVLRPDDVAKIGEAIKKMVRLYERVQVAKSRNLPVPGLEQVQEARLPGWW